MSDNNAPRKYFAFLSYSHSEITYARKLHTRLESYDISTLIEDAKKKQTIYPVCRDETAFSTGRLDSIIHEKLNESKKLIVICSHTSAMSPYVADEVNYFAEHSGIENIIPVIAEPYDNIEEVLPGILKEHNDILCIDRFGYEKKDESKMFFKLVAAILDIQFETVYNRDKAKKIRKRITASCICAIIAFVLTFAGLFFARKSVARAMSGDIKNAIATCDDDLYAGLNELQKLEKRANFWKLDLYEIRNVISEKLSFNAGDCLIRRDLGNSRKLNTVIFDNFIDDKNRIVFNDCCCYESNTGKKLLEFDVSGKISIYLNNGDVKIHNLPNEYYFISDLSYDDENNVYYFSLVGDKSYILSADGVTGELNFLADDAYFKGIYGYELYFLKNEEFFKVNLSDGEAIRLDSLYNDLIFDREGKIYWTDSNNVLFGNSVKNCYELYLSPDETVLFALTQDGFLYALDAETEKVLYSLPTYGYTCDVEFSRAGTGVLFSEYSDTDAYYCCFEISNGKVLYEKKAKQANREIEPIEGSQWRFCTLSPDGKFLAYTEDDRNITVKRLLDGSEILLEFDTVTKAFEFRDDSKALYVLSKAGMLYTMAVEDYNKFDETVFYEFISDPEDNSKALLLNNGFLFKPAFGGGYEEVYGTDYGLSNIISQTKDYYIIMTDLDTTTESIDYKYIKCKKDTYEVSDIKTILNEFPILKSYDNNTNVVHDIDDDSILLDVETDTVFENFKYKQFVPLVGIDDGYTQCKVSENKILVSPQYGTAGDVLLVDVNSGEKNKIFSVEANEYLKEFVNGQNVMLVAGNVGYKFNSDDGSYVTFSLPGRVFVDGTTGNTTTYFNETVTGPFMSEVLYYDAVKNRLVVVSTDTGEVIYQKQFDSNTGFCNFYRSDAFDSYHSAIFDKSGEYVFITYKNFVSQTEVTELVSLKDGSVFMKFEGYPICYEEYWSDRCARISNTGEVSSMRPDRRSDKLIISPLNTLKNSEDMLFKINGIYDFILNCQ